VGVVGPIFRVLAPLICDGVFSALQLQEEVEAY
jgi:hypothetical protein